MGGGALGEEKDRSSILDKQSVGATRTRSCFHLRRWRSVGPLLQHGPIPEQNPQFCPVWG